MTGILLVLAFIAGVVAPQEAPQVSEKVASYVDAEYNSETGLTDFKLLEETKFSLDVQPLDYSKLND